MTVIVINPTNAVTSGSRIGYRNLLTEGAVVASSENPSFPVENAYDGIASDFFRSAAGGVTTITLTLDEGATADYFAFYAQDVWEQSGTIKLQYWDGAAWVDTVGASPADNSPRMLFFDPVTSDQWRVHVTTPYAFNLGCVAFGEYLELPHGQYLGWTPPRLARAAEFVNSVSDRGTFLGRSYTSLGVAFSLVLQYAQDQWVRTNWLPFVQHAERSPFFFCPDVNNHAADTAWCWVQGDIAPPAHTHYGFMGTTLQLRGVME